MLPRTALPGEETAVEGRAEGRHRAQRVGLEKAEVSPEAGGKEAAGCQGVVKFQVQRSL